MLTFILMMEDGEKKDMLERLYIEYNKELFHVAYQILNNYHDAQDVSSVEAYRVKWLNTVSSIKEKFIQIDTIEESTDSSDNIPKDWGGKYYLTYLPAGYKLLQTVADDDFPILIYTNQNGNNIVFQQIQQGSSVRVDSENGKATNVIINDNQEAFLIEKGSERTLNWLQGDMAFHLEAHKLELPEFIQMAESIVIKNN